MNYSISISAFRRPDYLARVVDALRNCDGIKDWSVVAAVDKSAEADACAKIIKNRMPEARVFAQGSHKGIARNVWDAVSLAFCNVRTDCNLHIEDDVVLSPDALRLCRNVVPVKAQICYLNRRHDTIDEDPSKLEGWADFSPWGWCVTRDVFRDVLTPAWDFSGTVWTVNLHGALRNAGVMGLRPRFSRSLNIGREQGENDTPEYFDRNWASMKHLETPHTGDYST